MNPYQILIWGCGRDYAKSLNMVKYQELLGTIKVVGVTGKEKLYSCLDDYPVFKISDIKNIKFDYVLVASEVYFKEIYKDAITLGINEKIILPARIFQIPGFDFEKYVELLNSKITIIANNCWGGITYHSLGMQFLSPFINMSIRQKEYLSLLKNLEHYVSCSLEFKYWETDRLNMNYRYPVCALGDIELFCMHYSSFEDAKRKWDERCLRINWDNLFIMFFTEKKDLLASFEQLQFRKKVCFVPFESNLGSADAITFSSAAALRDKRWPHIVNDLAFSAYHSYDVIQLLLEGKPNYARIQ